MKRKLQNCPNCKQVMQLETYCSACNKELEKLYSDSKPTNQFIDALSIKFEGGYGMFYDDLDKDVLICNDCAKTLIKTNPWIEKILNNQ